MTVPASAPSIRRPVIGAVRSRLQLDPLHFGWGTVVTFLLPAAAVYVAFTAFPVVKTFYNSFFHIVPGVRSTFVGLENYRELFFQDPTFLIAVKNTILWAIVQPCIEVSLGLVLAFVLLQVGSKLSRVLRVVWFAPVLLSYVVVAIIWSWIYNYEWGIVNSLLRLVGLGSLAHSWLGDPKTALWALLVAQTWMWTGFNMVVCLAAISSLPSEVLEASELDNCGTWAKLWHIIVPMTRPTLVTLLTLSVMGKMRLFDLVWIMTKGGPLWSTETVATYVYKRAFDWNTFDIGYPSTIATIWFLAVLAAVLVINLALRRREKLEY